jgi:multicomponent Na+:H+ antiporter subunit G
MGLLADILSWAFILVGGVFAVIGGIGIVRLPDFYTRMHGAGITDTMGAYLLIAGMMLQAGWTLVTIKLILILVFVFFTSPTATHALAQAALGSGVEPVNTEDRRPKGTAPDVQPGAATEA